MTCIVGIETDDGHVLIGGDSAGVSGWNLTVRADEKVFARAPFVCGFTTSFRMGQLLRYGSLDPNLTHAQEDPDRFMATTFIDAVRECLKTGGYAKVENGVETGGTFLVGFAGRLYTVGDDFQIGRSEDGFDAAGCGGEIALGALHASIGKPLDRAKKALAAAERFSAGVRGPFHFVKSDPAA